MNRILLPVSVTILAGFRGAVKAMLLNLALFAALGLTAGAAIRLMSHQRSAISL